MEISIATCVSANHGRAITTLAVAAHVIEAKLRNLEDINGLMTIRIAEERLRNPHGTTEMSPAPVSGPLHRPDGARTESATLCEIEERIINEFLSKIKNGDDMDWFHSKYACIYLIRRIMLAAVAKPFIVRNFYSCVKNTVKRDVNATAVSESHAKSSIFNFNLE